MPNPRPSLEALATGGIPADLTPEEAKAAREWATDYLEGAAGSERVRAAARVVLATVPAPPRPTLADMTPAERRECRRMQADVKGMKGRRVIAYPGDGGEMTQIMLPNGPVVDIDPENVTPRPDLPRWEWPGTEKPAPVPALPHGWRLADHPVYGRVMVTSPAPDRDGYLWGFRPDGTREGADRIRCKPDKLTYIDSPATKGADTTTAPDHLAVGTVIESADDPRIAALPVGSILLDREGEATTKRRSGWTGAGYFPRPSDDGTFGPWKVLHIPKEADQ